MDKNEFVDVLAGRRYCVTVMNEGDHTVISRNTSSDRHDTHTTHDIVGIHVLPESETRYYDLELPYEPQFGQTYYLLYVVCSTGDSFGHYSCSDIEYIGLYKKEQLDIARENKQLIESSDGNDDYDITVKEPNGNRTFKFKQTTSWIGYFEHFEKCDIIEVTRKEYEE